MIERDEFLNDLKDVDIIKSKFVKINTATQNALLYVQLKKLNENIEKLVDEKSTTTKRTTTTKK